MADWITLQRKIFTRWVNQRLQKQHLPPLNDVVEDLGKGKNLVQLAEILSERTCTAKLHDKPRFKAQEIENLSQALSFVYECGVTMTLKPSPENLLEGDERAVLGLVWALMMKYLKFAQEDDETLSPKDALLRWVNLNTEGHAHAQARNFTTSFRDGMVLCALIHKFRPDLIGYDSLSPENPLHNLATAMKAAQAYFGLEQYVEPSDIAKLDEKSMLVYVSEYYSGITEQLKLDLAFRRISQLIEFTIVNDKMKAQYEEDAAKLRTRIQQAQEMLVSLPTKKDNTMAGARKLLDTFDNYRSAEKRDMYSEHIKLEALFTNLATRLADNKRPSFDPSDPELRIEARAKQLAALQDTEQSTGFELHNEVSRQLRLQQQHEQHTNRCEKIRQWVTEHGADLPDIASVQSSGQASNLLKFLEASEKEIGVLRNSSLSAVRSISAKLEEEGFEFLAEARKREEDLDKQLADFKSTLVERRPAFEDAYKRESFKEEVQRSIRVHSDLCEQLDTWGDTKRDYLSKKEDISSLEEAERQVSNLEAFDAEREDTIATSVAELKRLGANVRASSYVSEFSKWTLPDPAALETKEKAVDTMLDALAKLADHKREVLADDGEREQFAQATRLLANQHESKAALLQAWVAEKKQFLKQREECDTVEQAQFLLGVLTAYRQEKENVTTTALASLKQLGKDIQARKYETQYSTYVYEAPQDVQAREDLLHQAWKELDNLSSERQPFLEDHLARNEFQNKIRLLVKTHADAFKLLREWHATKRTYLQTRETIVSVDEAQLQVGILSAFRQEKKDTTEGSVAALKRLGAQIRQAEYKTQLSQWQYEAPEEVEALEKQVEEELWPELEAVAGEKQRVLEDDLAREQFKEATRLQVQNHVSGYEQLEAWCKEKLQYLETREEVANSEQAKVQLSLLDAFEQKKEGMYGTSVKTLKQLGRGICDAKFEGVYSTWVYERPDAVGEREAKIEGRWKEMAEKSAEKRAVLEDDKARELYAEETRLLAGRHESETTRLREWVASRAHYLKVREEIGSSQDARFHISLAEAFESERAAVKATSVVSLHGLRDTILARAYKSELSSYVFEAPEDIKARGAELDKAWGGLDGLLADKQAHLGDKLACMLLKEETELSTNIHRDMHDKIAQWYEEKLRALRERPTLTAVHECNLQLSLLEGFLGEQRDKEQGAVALFKERGAAIRSAQYKTTISEWTFPQPEKTTQLEEQVAGYWRELAAAAKEKRAFLDDCLARTQYCAKVARMVDQHVGLHRRLMGWIGTKMQALEQQPPVDSLADAAVKLRLMEALGTDLTNTRTATLASLQSLGSTICGSEYKSELSQWTFPDAAQVQAREAEADDGLKKLAGAIEAKKEKLATDQQMEQMKEDLRQEFAHAANAMRGFVKDNIIFVRGSLDGATTKATTFAFTLDETENMQSELEKDDKQLTQQAEQHKTACMQVHAKLAAYGPVTNPYTSLDENGLDKLQADLQAALSFRQEQYEKALAMQKANDELCREFAQTVNPLMESLRQSIDKMAKPEGSLSEQLETIESELASLVELKAKLEEVSKLAQRMQEEGIEYNPHSSVTLQDLTSQFDDYEKLLTYKKPLLAREIEFKRSRGVTKAQLEEIESFFKKFDRDDSGTIEKKELKACLFSLGEELTSAEVDKHIRTFGSGGRLNLQQFKELMIHLIGVIHTQEHILGSFSFIARDAERVELDKLSRLKSEHLEFVKKTVPSATKENMLDYQQFTEVVFAR